MTRSLFLKCVLVVSGTGVLLALLATKYAARVHGPSLVVVPIILIVMGRAAYEALRLAWAAEGKQQNFERVPLIHSARWMNYWAWLSPMIGMMGTVMGIWLILTSNGGTTANLHDRLLNGGAVVFAGTFVGILGAVMITTLHRLIEDALDW